MLRDEELEAALLVDPSELHARSRLHGRRERSQSAATAAPLAHPDVDPSAAPLDRLARPLRGDDLHQEVAVIVMPPRAFCVSGTRTPSASSPSASATSSRILTASASQKTPSLR